MRQSETIAGLSRRNFLKASSAVAAAFGLKAFGLLDRDAKALEAADGGVPVLWLQAQTCTGCSVSLLNTMHYATIDDLLVNALDVDFHPNLMAASGAPAIAAMDETYARGGYVLVVEGAIPSGASGKYCTIGPMTAAQALAKYASRAAFVMAVGTCACHGGVSAAKPNPTAAAGLSSAIGGKTVIKVPGCPVHPDWVVGTIAYLLTYGRVPALDTMGRPTEFFGRLLHGEWCPLKGTEEVEALGQYGCMQELGCKGAKCHADCNLRLWNTGKAEGKGVNWCGEAGAPCIGCTEGTFPDGMSPFYSEKEWGGD